MVLFLKLTLRVGGRDLWLPLEAGGRDPGGTLVPVGFVDQVYAITSSNLLKR